MEPVEIHVTFDHRSVQDSQSLTNYVLPKLQHVSQHGRVNRIDLVCSIENGQHIIKSVVTMPQKHQEGIDVSTRNMYESVDCLIPKIERVIRKNSNKMSEFKHDTVRKQGRL